MACLGVRDDSTSAVSEGAVVVARYFPNERTADIRCCRRARRVRPTRMAQGPAAIRCTPVTSADGDSVALRGGQRRPLRSDL